MDLPSFRALRETVGLQGLASLNSVPCTPRHPFLVPKVGPPGLSSSLAKPYCLPMMPESVSEHACTWYNLPIGAWLHMGACCVVLCSFWPDLHCACVVDFCAGMRTIVQFWAHGGPLGCCYRVRATARAHGMLLLQETPCMMLVHHFGGTKWVILPL